MARICGKVSISSTTNSDNLEFDFVNKLQIKEKKRKQYVTQKRLKVSKLLATAKNFKFQYNRIEINLSKDIEDIKSLTKSACIRPDIYLNNNNSCITCHIYENCACPLKKLNRKRRKN